MKIPPSVGHFTKKPIKDPLNAWMTKGILKSRARKVQLIKRAAQTQNPTHVTAKKTIHKKL